MTARIYPAPKPSEQKILLVSKPPNWRWLPMSIASSVIVFWLVSLTPDAQYALFCAAAAFIVASAVSVAQVWLALRQAELAVRRSELAEQMNQRYAKRFSHEQTEGNMKAELVGAVESGNGLEFGQADRLTKAPASGDYSSEIVEAILQFLPDEGLAPREELLKAVAGQLGLPLTKRLRSIVNKTILIEAASQRLKVDKTWTRIGRV